MKPNRCKQTMAAGKIPVGHMITEFGTRGIAKMLEQANLDFVIIDMEHTAFSADDVANLIAWFKATEIAPFVRIPQIEYHFVARTMDYGALGLMVPNVKTAAQAKAIVDGTKYAPLGQRGIMFGNSNTDFGAVDPAEFMRYANENTTIICQIESVAGLDNLEDIATIPGVDVLWIGHFDLTQSMGIPGQFHNAQFLSAMKDVVAMAQKHGLGAGIQAGNLEQAEEWMGMGFNVISYSADIGVYSSAMQDAVAGIQTLAEQGYSSPEKFCPISAP